MWNVLHFFNIPLHVQEVISRQQSSSRMLGLRQQRHTKAVSSENLWHCAQKKKKHCQGPLSRLPSLWAVTVVRLPPACLQLSALHRV